MNSREQISAGTERDPVSVRLGQTMGQQERRSAPAQLAIGVLSALAAVAIRYLLPLSPTQIPVITVIVAVAINSTFVGLLAGLTTAVVGGLLAWYVFFTPFSWELSWEGTLPLIGFSITASVIVTTSHLYRLSELRHHSAQLAAARKRAQDADLFAREIAHRLKNTLAIVQSIAFQTLGRDEAAAVAFSARLKALAGAHDLLSEHIERPTASAEDVVNAALEPFLDGRRRVQVTCAETTIGAQQVVSLALVLHELAANASKYGALSVPAGTVDLRIEDAGERIKLDWKERNGPRVNPPERDGFGSRLLHRVGSDAELSFEPDGLRCSLFLRKN